MNKRKCCIGIAAFILLAIIGLGSYFMWNALKWKYEESDVLWFGYYDGTICCEYSKNYTYPTPE